MTTEVGRSAARLGERLQVYGGDVPAITRVTRPLCSLARIGAAIAVAAIISAAPTPSEASNNICSAANVNALLKNGTRSTKINLRLFYDHAKDEFPIYRNQGDHYIGTDAIIEYFNRRPDIKDTRWLAYILATAYHETAFKMFPVRETLADTDEEAIRRLERFLPDKTYYHIRPETGFSYFGRGYVQLTHDYNYQEADRRLDFVDAQGEPDRSAGFYWNPDFALDPEQALEITYNGMLYGWFTSRCLQQYIRPGVRADFVGARRIINGTDRDRDIAELADKFYESLKAAEVQASFDVTQDAQKSTSLGEDVDALKTQEAALRKAIDDVRDELMTQIADLEKTLETERTRFETVTIANQRLANEISEARTTLATSGQEIAAARVDLDAARTEITETRSEITQARADIASLRDDVIVVGEELNALPKQLELTEADQQRLTNIESGMVDASTDRQLNRETVGALRQQVDALNQQLSAQNQQISDLLAAVEQANNRTLWSMFWGGGE